MTMIHPSPCHRRRHRKCDACHKSMRRIKNHVPQQLDHPHGSKNIIERVRKGLILCRMNRELFLIFVQLFVFLDTTSFELVVQDQKQASGDWKNTTRRNCQPEERATSSREWRRLPPKRIRKNPKLAPSMRLSMCQITYYFIHSSQISCPCFRQ